MRASLQFLTGLLFTCLSFHAHSETLRIVTEPWTPYVYLENGKAKGIDYDITALVFERLGIDVQWQFLPWKRCLQMLEQGQADGALDIFQTREREGLLLYPSEPLSDVEFVLFQANARPHPFKTLSDLKGLTVGTNPGYQYGDEFMQSSAIIREPAPSAEANFGKLQKGRIDLFITDRRVGEHTLKAMGLQDDISQLPVVLSRNRQFLAVRRNAGMDLLVQRFAAEMKRFKREPAYAKLLARYAGSSAGPVLPASARSQDALQNTARQQESSAR